MMEENASARGTSTPQGKDASTRKKSAPVSLTVRKTSESGSLPCVLHEADDSDVLDTSADRSARNIMDDATSDEDVWSWALTMPKDTLCALAYPPDASGLTISVEARRWTHSIKRSNLRKSTMLISCRRFLPNGVRWSR